MGDNYRLSICSIRGFVQKHGYIIESGGKTLESSVSSIEFSINLKGFAKCSGKRLEKCKALVTAR